MGQAAQLTKGLMARYGAPNIFLSLAAFPLAVHLPTFFSKYYGIAFGTVGALIFLSRLTDVITDPLIGTWSDKARSRFGRRKPFILAGVPIFMISIWFLFVPIDGMVTEGYVLFFIILLYFSYTLADLPYKAWGAELSHNYEERSRVTGWREGFGLAGLIMALAIPVVVDVLFPAAEGEAAMPRWMFAIAVVTVIGTPFLFFLTLKTVPEPAPDQLAQKRVGWGQGLRIVWQNKAFMKMLVALVAIVIGGTMTATLGLPFVTNVLDLPEQTYPFIILGYYAGATACVPLWVKLSDRIGKHKAVALALVWLSLWSAPIPFLPEGATALFVTCMVLKGTTVGALALLPPSMGADIIDHDTLQTGEQRSGLYFSLWGMVYKLSVAIGVLAATTIPASFGFNPALDVNDDAAKWAVAFCYSLGPALIALLALPSIWTFPITRAVQQQLRDQIEAEAEATPIAKGAL